MQVLQYLRYDEARRYCFPCKALRDKCSAQYHYIGREAVAEHDVSLVGFGAISIFVGVETAGIRRLHYHLWRGCGRGKPEPQTHTTACWEQRLPGAAMCHLGLRFIFDLKFQVIPSTSSSYQSAQRLWLSCRSILALQIPKIREMPCESLILAVGGRSPWRVSRRVTSA